MFATSKDPNFWLSFFSGYYLVQSKDIRWFFKYIVTNSSKKQYNYSNTILTIWTVFNWMLRCFPTLCRVYFIYQIIMVWKFILYFDVIIHLRNVHESIFLHTTIRNIENLYSIFYILYSLCYQKRQNEKYNMYNTI